MPSRAPSSPLPPRDVLRQIPLFAGLTDDECGRIVELSEHVSFQAGHVFLEQAEQSQQLWILLEGTCQVYCQKTAAGHPGEVLMATLTPYSTIGEMSFFHACPHSASVRAETAARLLRIDRDRYDADVERGDPAACKLALNTIASLSERLRRMDEWVVELSTRNGIATRVPELHQLRKILFDGWKL